MNTDEVRLADKWKMPKKQEEICRTHKEAGVTCALCKPQEEICENCGEYKEAHDGDLCPSAKDYGKKFKLSKRK